MTLSELATIIDTKTEQLKRNIARLGELRDTPSLPSNERELLRHIGNQQTELTKLNREYLAMRRENRNA